MKKIILISLALLLIPMVSAQFEEGDILNQTQVNQINADNLNPNNLQCRLETEFDNRKYFINHQWYYLRYFSCLELELLNSGDYLIVRENHTPHFKIVDFRACIEDRGRNQCVTDFRINLREQALQSIDIIIEEIRAFQDNNQDEDTDGFGGDIW